MPTILRIGPFRFFFYAGDRTEDPHIHVESENKIAKFWLDPIRLQNSRGFSRIDLKKIFDIIGNNREHLLESWYEYFND